MNFFQKHIGERWRRTGRITRRVVLGIVVLMVAIRLMLPFAIERYVNGKLNHISDYSGSIGDVTVHLWRGAYQVHNIKIQKKTGSVPVPFFSARVMDLAIDWHELVHGKIVGEVGLDQPALNFVEGSTPEQSQNGKNKPWVETLKSLHPFDINRFSLHDGRIHFQNFSKTPPVDIYITNLTTVVTNLTNARNVKEKLPAGLHATGDTLGGGKLVIDLKMNPLEKAPTFELNASLTNVDLTALNNFLRAYGKFDVASGEFAMFSSTAAEKGNYQGYVKVLFKHFDVFAWEKERKKNVLQAFWDAIVGAVTSVFKNPEKDQLATQIPISGSFEQSNVDVMSAVGSLLENAFIRALMPKIEPTVKVKDVEKQDQKQNNSQ